MTNGLKLPWKTGRRKDISDCGLFKELTQRRAGGYTELHREILICVNLRDLRENKKELIAQKI